MNRKIFLIIFLPLIALLLLLLSACGASWQTVSQSGFTIEMPGTPAEEPQSESGMTGNLYTVALNDEEFTFSYTDYQATFNAANPEELLNAATGGAVRSINGTVTSERSLTLNGKPGKEIIGDGTLPRNLTFISRIYWDSPRLYTLVYMRARGTPVSANGEKFLNSFKLTAK
jgi:hypothetical protein